MFGELLGLWAANIWRRMGAPKRFAWIELGPGRGTLMMDAVRAARVVPGFVAAAELHLVEVSPVLRRRQAETLAGAGVSPTWHDDLTSLPDLPAIVLANEFFDALPVFQYVKAEDGWHERRVGIDNERLVFTEAPETLPGLEQLPLNVGNAHHGAILEWRDEAAAHALGKRIVQGGAALVIDYGHVQSAAGDT
ncbi:MAG TPA: class I SAM-dependent methyltransferase, partial [Xanthobacteraceae bacterium]|nr:class I SAM-dependent methyltransferase [Xanthobacteraceae bacterium]